MSVTVPNLIGRGRTAAEAELDALLLRHIAQFPFGASGDGSASQQSPVGGTVVPEYSIVTVSYPTPFGPIPDSPVEGPTPPSGTYEGQINGVLAGSPGGSGQGAWADFVTLIDGSPVNFMVTLYFDQNVDPLPQLPRTEWMKRGAMLGLAERAFTNSHKVRLVINGELSVQSIEIFKS
jgi:hypothetical protein